MRVITVIPARGGSKSIPKKNIQPLDGKPLVSYSIDYSLKSDLVSKTIVSTDSLEISDICKKYGAEVPFLRPAELAGDDSTDYDFMRHALNYFEKRNEIYDLYILLRPTSPLRPKNLIDMALKIFIKNPDISSVRSVARDILKAETIVDFTQQADILERVSKRLGTSLRSRMNELENSFLR